MAEVPDADAAALDAAESAIRDAAAEFGDGDEVYGQPRDFARAALEAAAPVLAGRIASAVLRYADENEPVPGSAAYLTWHRHFDAASGVAARAFGQDRLEAGPLCRRCRTKGRDATVRYFCYTQSM